MECIASGMKAIRLGREWEPQPRTREVCVFTEWEKEMGKQTSTPMQGEGNGWGRWEVRDTNGGPRGIMYMSMVVQTFSEEAVQRQS